MINKLLSYEAIMFSKTSKNAMLLKHGGPYVLKQENYYHMKQA